MGDLALVPRLVSGSRGEGTRTLAPAARRSAGARGAGRGAQGGNGRARGDAQSSNGRQERTGHGMASRPLWKVGLGVGNGRGGVHLHRGRTGHRAGACGVDRNVRRVQSQRERCGRGFGGGSVNQAAQAHVDRGRPRLHCGQRGMALRAGPHERDVSPARARRLARAHDCAGRTTARTTAITGQRRLLRRVGARTSGWIAGRRVVGGAAGAKGQRLGRQCGYQLTHVGHVPGKGTQGSSRLGRELQGLRDATLVHACKTDA